MRETSMHRLARRQLSLAFTVFLLATVMAACGQSSGTPLPSGGGGSSAPPAGGTGSSPRSSNQGGTASSDCPPSGSEARLDGAGATFPAPLYQRWFADYKNLCSVEINYQAIGSGGGIQQHTQKTVQFGASDGILTAAQKEAAPGTI